MTGFFRLRRMLKVFVNNIFSAKNTDIRPLVRSNGEAPDDTVEYIINSSVVIRFRCKGREVFFRECRPHLQLRVHILQALDDYCGNITSFSSPELLSQTVKNDLEKRENYRKFLTIPQVFDNHLLQILDGSYGGYAAVGLPSFPGLNDHREFILLLKYFGGILSMYTVNGYLRKGLPENCNANRQMATCVLSNLLGIDNLIPEVRLVELNIGGRTRVGTIMNKAEGVSPAYLPPEKRASIDKRSFLRDLSNLELFDALCYQLDHRLDNYNVVYDADGCATGVSAFDNDANRTFFPMPVLPGITYAGASSVMKNGMVNRPFADKDFYLRIRDIGRQVIFQKLSPFLSVAQIIALWRRICILKDAMARTELLRPGFMLDSEKWASVDDAEWLDSKYGKTYYSLYRFDTVILDRESRFKRENECT